MGLEHGVRFAGYAAVFNRLDNGGDVIRPGAFADSLARKGAGVPLLWQHRTGAVIGTVEQVREDWRGLRVIGRIEGRELSPAVARMVGRGQLTGLSFGYRVRRSEQRETHRELTALELVEVSVVSRPMQPSAQIHAVDH